MKLIKSLDKILYYTETSILSLTLGISILLLLIQILLRYFFHTGIMWIDPLCRFSLIIFCLFGASLGFRYHEFIGMEILTKFLNPKHQAKVQTIAYIATGLIVIWLIRSAWGFLIQEKLAESTAVLGIPNWILVMVVPIGFCFILIRLILAVIIQIVEKSNYQGSTAQSGSSE
ncbi:MAG: TRAP transporter small permease subunit [Candidatus Delongbacteria bacterium]|nr:TRAP transporter small permease subunit [Candidatus Delongbacteria bacterium]